MKKIIIGILLLVFIMTFISCNSSNDLNNNDGDDGQTQKSEAEKAEETQLKQEALDFVELINSYEDPSTIFEAFTGDFSISDFQDSENGACIESIGRKDLITSVKAKYNTFHCLEHDGLMFYTKTINGFSSVYDALLLNSSAPDKSTIFTVFGFDSSGVYGSESNVSDPELDLDMLSVNKDKNTVVISKSYLDEIAKALCDSLGYTKENTEMFLSEYKGKGVYSPQKKRLTIEINLESDMLGNISQKSILMIDEDQKVSSVSSFEYSIPGLPQPIRSEISYKDIVYQGKTPVSAIVRMTSNAPIAFYYANISANWKNDSITYMIDVSDKTAPKADAVLERSLFSGNYVSGRKECALSIDLGKADSQFSFESYRYAYAEHKYPITSFKADKLSFSAPEQFESLPKTATDAITSFIETQFQQ